MELTEAGLGKMLSTVLPILDERQRRVLAGAQARALGRGGVTAVARSAGMSRSTVQKAVAEVDRGVVASAPVRAAGAGRKRLTEAQPELLSSLDGLVGPQSRGDPTCPLRWTSKSTANLADALAAIGHRASPDTVGRLLRGMGYSLQATSKQSEGRQHPDREQQFVYLSERVGEHLRTNQPVISIDTKKKRAVVGQRSSRGRGYQPRGEPERLDVHDFPDAEVGEAIPFGVHDIGANQGFVVVGSDPDTAAFTVATIGLWWELVGAPAYPDARRLLITADAGGSNSYRARIWKVGLGRLAAHTGLEITVCHLPPGTSKWNKIEHRLWSAVSTNSRGRPLTSHEVVVNLIGATTNGQGPKVRARGDPASYPLGVRVNDREPQAVPLTRHRFHGEWNYSVHPSPGPTSGSPS